jgi:hypothetical protein
MGARLGSAWFVVFGLKWLRPAEQNPQNLPSNVFRGNVLSCSPLHKCKWHTSTRVRVKVLGAVSEQTIEGERETSLTAVSHAIVSYRHIRQGIPFHLIQSDRRYPKG